ncbi:MAG: c-type cytochrome [Chloroflexota bacterium]
MINRRRLGARLLAVFVALGIVLALYSAAMAAPSADPVRGKTLWEASLCARCHGAQGQGLRAGPRAGDTRTPEQWIAQVRTPRSMMPSFRANQVPDQDIIDMNEYMKTLPAVTGFTPPAAQTTAADPPGKVLIEQKRCIACHGPNGPITNFQSTNRMPTTELVLAQLRNPRNLMPMFRPDQVSDAEAAQIAAFLASQFTQGTATPAAAPAATVAATPVATAVATAAPTATPAPVAPPAPTTLPRTGEPSLVLSLLTMAGTLIVGGAALRRRSR